MRTTTDLHAYVHLTDTDTITIMWMSYRGHQLDKVLPLHRLDGPACQVYRKDRLAEYSWYRKGILDRLDGPADVSCHDNGITSNVSFFSRGLLHRINAPASIDYNKDGKVVEAKWYENGSMYRHERY